MPNFAKSPRVSSANVHLGPKRHYDAEGSFIELSDRPEFKAARKTMLRFIEKKKECTVGQLRQAFPEWTDLIWHVMKDLKLEGKIDFDEHSPPPTIVRIGSMRRVHEPHYKSTATHREKNSEPFSPLDATI